MTISQATTVATSASHVTNAWDAWHAQKLPARRSQRRLLTDPVFAKLSLSSSEIAVVVPQPEPAWLYQVLDRLKHLSLLGENWDSYNGQSPSDESIFGALVVISRVLSPESRVPAIVPLSEGGIQIEWHGDGEELEIHVHSDGRISAFRFDEQAGEAYEVDDVGASDLSRLLALTGSR